MKNDPYWMSARFDSIAEDGTQVRRGDRVFYYPSERKVYAGERAEAESRRFDAAVQDEAVFNGGY